MITCKYYEQRMRRKNSLLEIVGRCKEEVWAFPAQLMNGSASVPGTGRTDYERFLGT